MRKADADFYRSIGICPRCGKEKLYGDEKNCLLCQAKSYKYSQNRDKEKYNETHREYSKKRYSECKELGICVRCFSRKAENNKVMCGICSSKMYEARRIRNYGKKIKPAGTCRFCNDKVVEGYKVCQHHLEMNRIKANLPQTKEARKKMELY